MHIEIDGLQLHYDVTGEGQPLLWLHGHMGHGPDWQYIFPGPPAGYRVIAPDLRGHGRSGGAGATYSFRQSAFDMFALLDALHLERVDIIGLSGGGITALHMATLNPGRVRSMVLISTPRAFPDQARAIQRAFSETMLSPAELEMMRARHSRPGQLQTLLAQANAFADGDDPNFTTEQLGRIVADTLIVFGDRDPFYPLSCALELRDGLPRAWLWVVPNGGHAPVFGEHAQAFGSLTVEFFGGKFRA
jgi:pimeloyl-ACP methyl ester carboxylesterase